MYECLLAVSYAYAITPAYTYNNTSNPTGTGVLTAYPQTWESLSTYYDPTVTTQQTPLIAFGKYLYYDLGG